ncbi:MAG: ATP-dependent DNA helicase RecG, partial [Paludibacteraceae bacterium]|nr:ATP-dependent DNA helicase RecG [Paludibacteraceae bacterium]
ALMVALLVIDNGYQACIMAPTEILANQHLATLRHMLQGSDVRVELLTGSTTKKQRAELLPALERGEIDLLIGTHALIEDTVQFANVGLVIVDEQHRFGVAQRARLWGKNRTAPPHVLVMTATPIPRTLAMTVYGDLQVSVIDELPPGRKPIQTYHYSNQRRKSINEFITKQVGLGRQIYVVYPLIQENEELDLADLENGYNTLVQAFPQFRISMVHGKMKAADKDLQMRRFVSGETQILVATTVIEVGVNVPNASVMIIEDAQRFGLSQLHQLRGRVGRGAEQSYCILLTPPEMSADTRKRMDIMCATNDGFRIAEADLELRGPGDMDGTMQSGMALDFKIANLATDGQILQLARDAANSVLDDDPTLSTAYTQIYRDNLAKFKSAAVEYREIS